MSAKAEDWIKHGADRVGERRAVGHGDRRPNPTAAAEEARPIGLKVPIAKGLAFHDGEMRHPDLSVLGRASPPRGQNGSGIGNELRFDEQLGVCRVLIVGGMRGQHDFSVGGQLDFPILAAVVGDRDTTNLRVVLRCDCQLQCCRDRAVLPDDFREPSENSTS